MRGRRVYGSLTGKVDLNEMRSLVVAYVRFLAFSVTALTLAACAKLAPADLGMRRPEPKFGEPPEAAKMLTEQAPSQSQAESVEALEHQVAVIDAELANLRKALDVMGPLPEQADLFIATMIEDMPEADPQMENAARLVQLYAPALQLHSASPLFFEAELGALHHRFAKPGSGNLAVSRLACLDPRFGADRAPTRLTVDALAGEAAVDALCVELSALTGACRVAAPVRAY
jgi:hypothetical protein